MIQQGERTPVKSFRVRPYRPDDAVSICELYQLVFGRPLTEQEWRWRHLENPEPRPIVYVAEDSNGALVGHFALVPAALRNGGVVSRAALSIQSMVHPSWQKCGVLSQLANAAERQLVEDGVRVAYAFLNDNSRHAYVERFGWTAYAGANFIYFRVLDSRRIMTSRAPKGRALIAFEPIVRSLVDRVFRASPAPDSDGASLRQVSRFDARVDDLWRRISRTAGNAVERDARYLNWRIGDKPDTYRSWVYEDRNGQLRGLVIIKTEPRFGVTVGYIVELLIDPDDRRAGSILVDVAVRAMQEQGCSIVSALSLGSDLVLAVLTQSGFRRLPRFVMPHGIHFCQRWLAGSGETNSRWFLSWLDHDVI